MVYLDSSAIVKLVVDEPESAVLRRELASRPEWTSSALAQVEVVRALRRAHVAPAALRYAAEMLDRIALVAVDDGVLEAAATAEPAALRSLDAIHLATAASLSGLEAVVAYDRRLVDAALAAGLSVLSPGVDRESLPGSGR